MKLKKRVSSVLLCLTLVMSTNISGLAQAGSQTAGDTGLVSHEDLSDNDTSAPEAWGATPSPNQLEYHRQELSAFMHFGMNTFTNEEWGNGKESPSQFTLSNDFDAERIVKSLKEAGFEKLIVTAKHHDGFCIWPSEYTEHSVKNSPYKDGEGDILAEVSAACSKYDMDMGLYMSPWDVNAPSYGYYDADGNALLDSNGKPKNGLTWDDVYEQDALDYNEYYMNQIKEIAGDPKYGNNGRFVEWWMDGAKGAGADAQEYEQVKWFETIQSLQGIEAGYDDDCLLFGAGAYTTVYWIGNESGYAYTTTWAKRTVNRENNTISGNRQQRTDEFGTDYYHIGEENGNLWSVPECDARITPGWFWHPNQAPKTMAQLSEMYFRSVGHNSTFLLNFPPNRDGTLDEAVYDRMKEFGDAVKNTFGKNYASSEDGATAAASEVRGNSTAFSPMNVLDNDDETYWTTNDGTNTGTITIDLPERTVFDVVSIQEYIPLGQRVKSFTVEYRDGDGAWNLLKSLTTIGHKRLIRFNPVRATQVRLTITGCNEAPVISRFGVYKATGGFEIGDVTPDGMEFIDDRAFTYSTGWTKSTTGLSNTNTYSSSTGSTAKFSFNGTSFLLVANVDPGHGIVKVEIDGDDYGEWDTWSGVRKLSQTVYQSPMLEKGQHEVKLTVTGKKNNASTGTAIDLDGAYYTVEHTGGIFELDANSYDVYAGDKLTFTVKRTGNTEAEEMVLIADNPGSAVQGQYYENISEYLTFAPGETEKTFVLDTYISEEHTDGTLQYYLELSNPQGGLLGVKTYSTVYLHHYKLDLQSLVDAMTDKNEDYFTGNYKEYESALRRAESVLKDSRATRQEVREALVQLQNAIDNLELRTGFTEEDPLIFPTGYGVRKTVEAEFFELIMRVPNETPNSTNKNVRLSPNANASNGYEVNWFENGNKIQVDYYAEEAGIYTVTATFRSGRTASMDPNVFNWYERDGKIKPGEVGVMGPDASIFQTVSLEVEILEPGAGKWIFDATSKAGPVIDKFEIQQNTELLRLDELQSLYDEHKEKDQKDYTAASWTAFAEALAEAEAVLSENDPNQKQVDKALSALKEAAEKLVKKDPQPNVEKRYLKQVIDEAEAITASVDYPGTINKLVQRKFEEALQRAKEVYLNGDADQEMVNEAKERLVTMMQYLKFTADLKSLEDAIDHAEYIAASGVYEEDAAMNRYRELIQEAKEILEDPMTLDEDIDDIIARLAEAEAKLNKKIPLDLRFLMEEIRLAEIAEEILQDKYLDLNKDDYKEFRDALDQARAVMESPQNQDEIDDAASNLLKARMNLRLKPSKDALKELMGVAAGKRAADYTAASFSVLLEAQENAQKVLDDPQATEEDIKNAMIDLQAALKQLVSIKDDDKKPGDDDKKPGDDDKKPGDDNKKPGGDDKKPGDDDKKPGDDDKKPGDGDGKGSGTGKVNNSGKSGAKTGDNSSIGLLAVLLIISLLSSTIVINRKKHKNEQ